MAATRRRRPRRPGPAALRSRRLTARVAATLDRRRSCRGPSARRSRRRRNRRPACSARRTRSWRRSTAAPKKPAAEARPEAAQADRLPRRVAGQGQEPGRLPEELQAAGRGHAVGPEVDLSPGRRRPAPRSRGDVQRPARAPRVQAQGPGIDRRDRRPRLHPHADVRLHGQRQPRPGRPDQRDLAARGESGHRPGRAAGRRLPPRVRRALDTLQFDFEKPIDVEELVDRIEDDPPPGVKVRVASDASACDVTVQGSPVAFTSSGRPCESKARRGCHRTRWSSSSSRSKADSGARRGCGRSEGEETGNENAEDVTKSLLAFWPCAGMILVASRRQPRAAYHTDIFSQSHLGVRHGTRHVFRSAWRSRTSKLRGSSTRSSASRPSWESRHRTG